MNFDIMIGDSFYCNEVDIKDREHDKYMTVTKIEPNYITFEWSLVNDKTRTGRWKMRKYKLEQLIYKGRHVGNVTCIQIGDGGNGTTAEILTEGKKTPEVAP